MATRLGTFIAAVDDTLRAAGIVVEMREDRESLDFHGVKRRIVWLTTGGSIVPPNQAGPRLRTGSATEVVTACKVRVERVFAYIYGGSREATETLLDAVIAACCEVGGVPLEMPEYDWVTQEDNRSGKTLRTQLVRLEIRIRLPVNAELATLTPILSVQDDCGTLSGTEDDWTVTPQEPEPEPEPDP